MPQMLGYLRLQDPRTGQCIDLIDNCRTLSAAGKNPEWRTNEHCEDCCPDCLDAEYSGRPSLDNAWWTGSGDPAEDEFYGFVAKDVSLEGAATSRRLGETTQEPLPYTPRRLVFSGYFMSKTRRGTYFGETAFTRVLTGNGPCGADCDGWSAEMKAFCLDEDQLPEEPVLDVWAPDPLPDLIDDPDECNPCKRVDPSYEPTTLLPPTNPLPEAIDLGTRSLFRLKFVSLDEDEDNVDLWPYCWGRFVRITFEVLDDFEWGDEVEVDCPLDLGFDEYDSGRCRPIDWTKCSRIGSGSLCEDVDAGLTENRGIVESERTPQPNSTIYCSPLLRTVRTCLTPRLPSAAETAPVLRFSSGSTAMRNAKIQIHRAVHGMPDPQTCEGEAYYSHVRPCAEGFVRLPARATLEVDPRGQAAWLTCSGATERADNLLEGWTWPLLDPTCRYWVTIVADCLNTSPEAKAKVAMVPRYQT